MPHEHTCVSVGNKIQYTGPDSKNRFLKTGEIGTISDILIWTDSPNSAPRIYIQFEKTYFGITLADISPNSTEYRLYHSEETLRNMKLRMEHFGIDYCME